MSNQTWWFLSRSSGLVAATMLILSLVWGVLLATRVLRPADRPAWLLSLHRWFSGLAIIGTVIHLGALVADSYVHFGPSELLVPMASTWKPGAVTYGVVGMYLLVIVQVTSLMMKKLPKRAWRSIHMSSYVMVWLIAMHAGFAGTDASNIVYRCVAVALTIIAVTATVLRVTNGRYADQRKKAAGADQRNKAAGAARPPMVPALGDDAWRAPKPSATGEDDAANSAR